MPVKAVPIVLNDGKPRELRFDFNSLVKIEDELKLSIAEIGKIIAGVGSMRQIRAILWAGLSHSGEKLTVEDVGNFIDLSGDREGSLAYIAGKLSEAFMAAFPIEKEPKKDDGPKPEKKENPGTGQNT
jgi:hypothetical protein